MGNKDEFLNGVNPRILQRINVAGTDEWRYRDAATGKVYTAVEARQLTGPTIVVDLTREGNGAK